ncbi:MAG: hypothetical protein MK132_22610 [Lentisphaerales bacterium]|nr:hypothetical protein [Lentisphaerales bacterium]
MHILRHIFIALLFCFSAHSLEIENKYVGFNNNIHTDAFNFITFTLHNDSTTPFEGEITLKDAGIGVKTISTKSVFLTPNQRKSVQMYFFVEKSYNDLILQTGTKNERIQLPSSHKPAHIFISSSKIRLPKAIKHFQLENFPSSVAYTHGLHSVTLDTVPDWSPNQKKAFMDWLRLGGTAYILQKQSGKYPKFTSSMAALNSTAKKTKMGSGIIHKAINLSEVNLLVAKPQDFKQNNYYTDDTENIFANLQLLVKTDHNWAFIYFLIVVYLILIGPANYIIGRKARDWKIPNLFFLLTVIIFSVIFSIIGRRGYGEETKINSFTLADHISENNYLVKQWSNIFVTSGNTYSFKHSTENNIYASPANFEMATQIHQSDASFVADIPLFSSKRMIHMGTGKGELFTFSDLQKNQQIYSIKVNNDNKIKKAWFVANGKAFQTVLKDGTYQSTQPVEYDHLYNTDAEKAYKVIEQIILKQASENQNHALAPRIDPYQNLDSVHFYALTETPESFHSVGIISDNETGWTLNRFKLNLDEAL